MEPQISQNAFDQFFFWAPWVLAIVIYGTFYFAKRHEETVPGSSGGIGQTFACANCGRRGSRDHMVPKQHEGAVSWYCPRCANN